jgi:DNA-binding PadR family transcriptional regulator
VQLDALLRALRADPNRWRHGYDLANEVGLAVGTLYPALGRLAEDDLLEQRWELPPVSARPRHLYRLTAAGVALADARAAAAASKARPKPTARPTPQV